MSPHRGAAAEPQGWQPDRGLRPTYAAGVRETPVRLPHGASRHRPLSAGCAPLSGSRIFENY